MAHLAGQFAGILRVEIDPQQADALTSALKNLTGAGLESVVHPDPAPPIDDKCSSVHLSLVGQDRPGIVREISRVLASQGVNVEELSTECTNAPNTGQPLFRATAQLRLPSHLSVETLHSELERVAEDLMVDISLE